MHQTSQATRRIVTRYLRPGDIPALIHLERKQWSDEQCASEAEFRARIEAHPRLCGGAFCANTGELLASLFCKPAGMTDWTNPGTWSQCAALEPEAPRATTHLGAGLFGISLTSVEPRAALQLIAFQFLDAIKLGRRHVYLGSPMPGLRRHLASDPAASVEAYAKATKLGLPVDPQLRYYHGKGFRELVAVRAEYFPHEASCDYGAILKAEVPYMALRPLVRLLPEALLRWVAARAPRLAIP
jgi:hypothetical protein